MGALYGLPETRKTGYLCAAAGALRFRPPQPVQQEPIRMDSFELNKILGAVLGTCLALLSLNIAAGALFTAHSPEVRVMRDGQRTRQQVPLNRQRELVCPTPGGVLRILASTVVQPIDETALACQRRGITIKSV